MQTTGILLLKRNRNMDKVGKTETEGVASLPVIIARESEENLARAVCLVGNLSTESCSHCQNVF